MLLTPLRTVGMLGMAWLISTSIAAQPPSEMEPYGLPSLQHLDPDRLFESLHGARLIAKSGAGYEAARVVAAIATRAAATDPGREAQACLDAWHLSIEEVQHGQRSEIDRKVAEHIDDQGEGRGVSEIHMRNLLELGLHEQAAQALEESGQVEAIFERWGIPQPNRSVPASLVETLHSIEQRIKLNRRAAMLWGVDREAAEIASELLRRREPDQDDDHDYEEHRLELLSNAVRHLLRLAEGEPQGARTLSQVILAVAPESLAAATARTVLDRTTTSAPQSPRIAGSKRVRALPDPGAEMFASPEVRNYQIELSPEAIQQLQAEPKEYVRARFGERDRVYENVGVRLKGSSGSFRMIDGESKVGFTVKFNQYDKDQRFHGLSRIVLNNSVQDPSYLCEYLGYELFRAADIPAPRMGHATLSINGDEYGLYNQMEAVTSDFLKGWFEKSGGNLYEGPGDVVNWQDLELDSNSEKNDRGDLRQLARCIEEADIDNPWPALAKCVDVDMVARFVAMEELLHHWDGYTAANNYRLYHDPSSKQFCFIPHGCDQLFEEVGHDLFRDQRGVLARALLQTETGLQAYRAALRRLLNTVWDEDQIRERIADAYLRIRPYVSVDTGKGGIRLEEFEHRVHHILRFVALRRAVVEHFLNRAPRETSWRDEVEDDYPPFLGDNEWE